jgi:hypothetical protein
MRTLLFARALCQRYVFFTTSIFKAASVVLRLGRSPVSDWGPGPKSRSIATPS